MGQETESLLNLLNFKRCEGMDEKSDELTIKHLQFCGMYEHYKNTKAFLNVYQKIYEPEMCLRIPNINYEPIRDLEIDVLRNKSEYLFTATNWFRQLYSGKTGFGVSPFKDIIQLEKDPLINVYVVSIDNINEDKKDGGIEQVLLKIDYEQPENEEIKTTKILFNFINSGLNGYKDIMELNNIKYRKL